MSDLRPFTAALALAGLVACGRPVPDLGGLAGLGEPEVTRMTQAAPPGADPGTCWGKHATPAIIETVTNQVMMQPAEVLSDGTVTRPAIYKTETMQQIVRERRETWFQTPCEQAMTPEFVASLQRALTARHLYRGPVSGEMDARTRAAVRRYQQPLGLDSGILSLAAARELGLVAVERDKT
ncbi:MAG: peptidoglycan-binding protein [Rhodobacteraceae bacterium]|nr:peptidoglycan-binding protein [Paracoccaceae bacterium]